MLLAFNKLCPQEAYFNPMAGQLFLVQIPPLCSLRQNGEYFYDHYDTTFEALLAYFVPKLMDLFVFFFQKFGLDFIFTDSSLNNNESMPYPRLKMPTVRESATSLIFYFMHLT